MSYSTGLLATTTDDVASCVAAAALVWFLAMLAIGTVVAPLFATLSSTYEPLSMANASSCLPVRYGGEAAEVIRYMECERVLRPEPSELSAGAEHWLARVEAEKQLIEALPFVTGTVAFVFGEKANLNKVKAAVTCCWEAGHGFERVMMSCDESGARPTHLEALVALRLKLIKDHGGALHKHDERAVARRAALERESSEQEAPTAFDRLRLAHQRW